MKKLFKFSKIKQSPKFDQCAPFQIKKEESDFLYGGYKEDKPPIYEQEDINDYSFETTDLLADINQKK